MNIICGIIGPIGIIVLLSIYFLLTITALYFVVKNEKSLFLFFWIILILFIPLLGSIIYIGKHYLEKNSAHNKS
jgi:hypothetical protein